MTKSKKMYIIKVLDILDVEENGEILSVRLQPEAMWEQAHPPRYLNLKQSIILGCFLFLIRQ